MDQLLLLSQLVCWKHKGREQLPQRTTNCDSAVSIQDHTLKFLVCFSMSLADASKQKLCLSEKGEGKR